MTPALAKARAVEVPKRVQAISSGFDEIVLRNGEGLRQHIGTVQPTPTLKRGMGNSTIEITFHDSKLEWPRSSLSGTKWDARIDGLWFRYLGTAKSGRQMTLRFEDLNVARLREKRGPIRQLAHRGKPNEVTRAEFIVGLVKEALPGVTIVCPELHDRQPIATEREGKEAQRDAEVNREPGLGDVRGLTIKGDAATKEQIELGDRAIRTAESLNAPAAVIVAMIATLAVESLLGKVSRNFMQMTPETAGASKYNPTVLEEAVTGFLKGYVPGHQGAISYARENPDAKPHEIAQAVQRSDAGAASNGADNYGPWVDEGREWLEAFGGAGGAPESVKTTKPTEFKVEKRETYWAAIQRMADEVNWRAFFVGDRFYYIDEYALLRSQPRLAISLDDEGLWSPDGIEDVDFDYNENKPASTITITAPVGKVGAPPGAVVTLEGCGPASIGFGDAPVEANKKGERRGISSNRNAATGEGRGRYLVSAIDVPIDGKGEVRIATITARRPTPPRPEPANETSTKTADAGRPSLSASGGAAQMVEWAKSVVGTAEGSGRHRKWASDLGYGTDLPWCSIFIGFGLKNIVGLSNLPPNPAYSGAWLSWSGGKRIGTSELEPGDLIVYDWGDGGITDHVALYIGDGRRVGGNESDRVSESGADLGAAVGCVRPFYEEQ